MERKLTIGKTSTVETVSPFDRRFVTARRTMGRPQQKELIMERFEKGDRVEVIEGDFVGEKGRVIATDENDGTALIKLDDKNLGMNGRYWKYTSNLRKIKTAAQVAAAAGAQVAAVWEAAQVAAAAVWAAAPARDAADDPTPDRLTVLKESGLWASNDKLLTQIAEHETLFTKEGLTHDETRGLAREIMLHRMYIKANPPPAPKHPDVQRALKNYPRED